MSSVGEIAHVGDGVNELHQALSLVRTQVNKLNPHAWIAARVEGARLIDPLHPPEQRELLGAIGWSEAQRDESPDFKRSQRRDKNAQLRNIGEGRVEKSVVSDTIHRPLH